MSGAVPRQPLWERTAVVLRRGIDTGRWAEELPGEYELCRELEISRPTLRLALAQLARDGLISLGGHGRRHNVLKRQTKAPAVSGKIVRYLSGVAPYDLGNVSAVVLHTLTTRLSSVGYQVQYEHEAAIYSRFSESRMRRLARLPDTAGWVLLNATSEMQAWFMRTGTPCVVTGALHSGVTLPFVAFDHAAACRHAVSTLLGKGHRRIGYVLPKRRTASQEFALKGFQSAFTAPGKSTGYLLLEHDQTVQGVCRAIDHALLDAAPPTGYVVSNGGWAVTVLGHLQRRGISVPARSSVIAMNDEVGLTRIVPAVAHYFLDAMAVGRSAVRMLHQLLRQGVCTMMPRLIMPDFVPGESIGPAPV